MIIDEGQQEGHSEVVAVLAMAKHMLIIRTGDPQQPTKKYKLRQLGSPMEACGHQRHREMAALLRAQLMICSRIGHSFCFSRGANSRS